MTKYSSLFVAGLRSGPPNRNHVNSKYKEKSQSQISSATLKGWVFILNHNNNFSI